MPAWASVFLSPFIHAHVVYRMQIERLEHSKTKYILSAEQEKLQLSMAEVGVLRKQLDREKTTFDEA